MTTQTDLRQDPDTLADADLADDPSRPVLLLANDAEIVRRIRLACPRWWEESPSQALVSAIAVNHDRELGLRGTCGTDRARRLRELAANPDLTLDEDEQVDAEVPDSESVEAAWRALVSGVDEPAGQAIQQIKSEPAPPPARRPVRAWPVLLLAAPAFVAVWSGWVGLGRLTGFGLVNLLPGVVADAGWATIDTAITLPIGVEAYAAFALWVWLSGRCPDRARRFARWSAITSLIVGSLGQVAYHLMTAAGVTVANAPWQITTLVAILPVAIVGMGAALAHLVRAERD